MDGRSLEILREPPALLSILAGKDPTAALCHACATGPSCHILQGGRGAPEGAAVSALPSVTHFGPSAAPDPWLPAVSPSARSSAVTSSAVRGTSSTRRCATACRWPSGRA